MMKMGRYTPTPTLPYGKVGVGVKENKQPSPKIIIWGDGELKKVKFVRRFL